jgi:hypothetical protein
MIKGQFYGPAFYEVVVDVDGRMYIHNEEYISQVNYHPITGEEAKTQKEVK